MSLFLYHRKCWKCTANYFSHSTAFAKVRISNQCSRTKLGQTYYHYSLVRRCPLVHSRLAFDTDSGISNFSVPSQLAVTTCGKIKQSSVHFPNFSIFPYFNKFSVVASTFGTRFLFMWTGRNGLWKFLLTSQFLNFEFLFVKTRLVYLRCTGEFLTSAVLSDPLASFTARLTDICPTSKPTSM